eukprot:CAMPEP_0116113068 /NCGR_PEP_ID=MMETSP0327-20121206/19311_1 /TAXON_ID=44447 /ORGANISM="Pseudo-nitzschia delicatissima, Strain B596" /LENGTH=302 /DNA_ID=CAMNT_0003606401 /DNA_START=97 /DNA_END=1005 /DNA_ORIENTATION=-
MTSALPRILPKLALCAPLRSVVALKGQSELFLGCQRLDNGFSGVEASLDDLGADGQEQRGSAQLIEEEGLELIINLDAECPRSFESQLDAISNLGRVVTHVNCRCGDGKMDQDAALDFLLHVLPLSAEFLEDHSHIGRHGNETDVMGGAPNHLTGISHETRGMLHNLDTTRDLLEVVPPLRLTMDLSSWQHKSSCEDDDESLSVEIVPHIDLIRTKASLIDDNYDPHLGAHQSLWETVWTRKANRGVEQLYMMLDSGCCDAYLLYHEEKYWSRIQRLNRAANSIHQYYNDWSTSVELETQSS